MREDGHTTVTPQTLELLMTTVWLGLPALVRSAEARGNSLGGQVQSHSKEGNKTNKAVYKYKKHNVT